MGRIVGIDFGTTNSLVACFDGRDPFIIPNERGARFTPSIVAVDERGAFLVGEAARNQLAVNSAHSVVAVKRSIGKDSSFVLRGRTYAPEQIASEILKRLKGDAERWLGESVTKAVITVPAYFSERERRSVRHAGKLAGLEVARIINEPTAASIAWSWSTRDSKGAEGCRRVLVYDLGGGTFDVTLLELDGALSRVRSSRGEGRLGGMDFDKMVFDALSASFSRQTSADFLSNPALLQQMRDLAERTKIELSSVTEFSAALPFVSHEGNVDNLSCTVTRAEFETMIHPLLERTIGLSETCVRDAGIEPDGLDALVLSGGSSRIPAVSSLLFSLTGRRAEARINPEEIVALGAAVEGAVLEGKVAGFKIHDVVSRTFGVEIDGGVFVPVIGKNTPLPAERTRVFTTIEDRQDQAQIHVLQGESRDSSNNLSLGRFLLGDILPGKKGDARIEVSFAIDEDDILHVSARDLDTKSEQSIIIAKETHSGEHASETVIASLRARVLEMKKGLSLDSDFEREIDEMTAVDGVKKVLNAADIKTALETILAELEHVKKHGGET